MKKAGKVSWGFFGFLLKALLHPLLPMKSDTIKKNQNHRKLVPALLECLYELLLL